MLSESETAPSKAPLALTSPRFLPPPDLCANWQSFLTISKNSSRSISPSLSTSTALIA